MVIFLIINININFPEHIGCIQLGDVINNTIENSEDTSTPSSDKINNLHETVYLFKLLYPKTKHKKIKVNILEEVKKLLMKN